MDGWFIGLLAGALLLVVLVVLLSVEVKAAARTAATAEAVLAALDEVKVNTAPLAALSSLERLSAPEGGGTTTGAAPGRVEDGGNGAAT